MYWNYNYSGGGEQSSFSSMSHTNMSSGFKEQNIREKIKLCWDECVKSQLVFSQLSCSCIWNIKNDKKVFLRGCRLYNKAISINIIFVH